MKCISLIAWVVMATSSSALADFSLSWSPVSSTSTGGAPIVVNLIMTETVTNDISTFGLAGGSVKITRSGDGAIGSFSASNLGVLDWDTSYIAAGSDPVVTINQTSLLGAGIGSSTVNLGSFTINTSLGIAHTGSLSVTGLNGIADDLAVYIDDGLGGVTTKNLGIGTLDNVFSSAPIFNYSFTAVPEPTTLGASVMLLGTWVLRRRMRKAGT